MSNNKIEFVAQMLGLEMLEEFKIKEDNKLKPHFYRFTEDGLMLSTDRSRWLIVTSSLRELLCGIASVVKLPWRPDERTKYFYIDYDKESLLPEVRTTIYVSSCYEDVLNVKIGNCFRSEPEAQKYKADFAHWMSSESKSLEWKHDE